jgi:hypothetical protein
LLVLLEKLGLQPRARTVLVFGLGGFEALLQLRDPKGGDLQVGQFLLEFLHGGFQADVGSEVLPHARLFKGVFLLGNPGVGGVPLLPHFHLQPFLLEVVHHPLQVEAVLVPNIPV